MHTTTPRGGSLHDERSALEWEDHLDDDVNNHDHDDDEMAGRS